jgi:4a-hydroxytetrahydrobiopterin dehydratase
MNKFNEAEALERLGVLPGWSLKDHKWIVRKYRFPEFMLGIAFVQEVAHIAEELNHHPMISIDFRVVTLSLTSWSAAGLTELDFTSAARYDEAYSRSSIPAQMPSQEPGTSA